MLKTLKPDHYYIIVNLDEPYAQDIYEVLRYGQKQKERLGEDAWPEGDVDYMEWVKQTWANACPRDRLAAIQAARIGQAANLHDSSWPEREYYSLLASIRAERDALAAEVERLRCFAELVAAGEPSPAEHNPSADGRDEALSSGNSGDIEFYGIMTVYYQLAQKAKAVLLQPQGGE